MKFLCPRCRRLLEEKANTPARRVINFGESQRTFAMGASPPSTLTRTRPFEVFLPLDAGSSLCVICEKE